MIQTNTFGQPVGETISGWVPRPAPQHIRLEGQYCYLEGISVKHASALYQALISAGEDKTWTWLFADTPHNEEEYSRRIEHMSASRDPLFFTIFSQSSGQPVGTISLMRIDTANGVIETGNVHFSPLLQKTAAATEVHWLLMRYVFETLGYRRYEWKCDSLNQPSRQAAQRLGFQFEGIFRQAIVYKDRNRDTAWFSIIDKEWPLTNHALQLWLDARNFTAEGQQRRSLTAIRTSL